MTALSAAGCDDLAQGTITAGGGSLGPSAPSASAGEAGPGAAQAGTSGTASGGSAGDSAVSAGPFSAGGNGGNGGSAGAAGSAGQVGGAGASSAGTAGGGGGGGVGGSAAGISGTIPAKQALRVAFIGDSANGQDFKDVLRLIKSEGADFVIHEGDFDYESDPDAFFATIDAELGADYPYFAAVGNHDAPEWEGYARHLASHLTKSQVKLDDPDMLDQKYAFDYQGLRLVFVGENGNNDEFADYVDQQLADDDHLWRVCNWHKNQKAMQIGGKSDEMGWGVYESCRRAGALVMTGHEHSYERTKTLTSFEQQSFDPTCADPNELCVGPGRSFAVVTGLGGNGVRPQLRCLPETYPYGCKGEWAFIYASNQKAKFGALFIDFYVGGDPRRAAGYFENVDHQRVDEFEITQDAR